MPRTQAIRVSGRGALKSTVAGFLGAYSGRHTMIDGYWLLGFLVPDHLPLEVDLCAPPPELVQGLRETAVAEARRAFREQASRNDLPWAHIASASLRIRSEGARSGSVNGHRREGIQMALEVTAVHRSGRGCAGRTEMFVAPHDPGVERRSAWA